MEYNNHICCRSSLWNVPDAVEEESDDESSDGGGDLGYMEDVSSLDAAGEGEVRTGAVGLQSDTSTDSFARVIGDMVSTGEKLCWREGCVA